MTGLPVSLVSQVKTSGQGRPRALNLIFLGGSGGLTGFPGSSALLMVSGLSCWAAAPPRLTARRVRTARRRRGETLNAGMSYPCPKVAEEKARRRTSRPRHTYRQYPCNPQVRQTPDSFMNNLAVWAVFAQAIASA